MPTGIYIYYIYTNVYMYIYIYTLVYSTLVHMLHSIYVAYDTPTDVVSQLKFIFWF